MQRVKMAKSKSCEKNSEEVFEYIDRVFAEGKEDSLVKLRESIWLDLDTRLRRLTKDIGRSQEGIPYERLVSHLESQILYLEDELRKKDLLIEKLIDNSLKPTKSTYHPVSNSNYVFSDKNHSEISSHEEKSHCQNNTKTDVVNSDLNSFTPNGLIDFQFDNENDNMTTEVGKTEMVNKSVNKSVINKRKRVIICGDSMVNGIDSDGVSSKSFSTVVKPFGGASSADMKDYIKPALKTKPDKMIVHVGTNDMTKGIQNTTENLSDIVECARELSPETQLYISAVCIRKDIPSHFKKVSDLNKSIKSFLQNKKYSIY